MRADNKRTFCRQTTMDERCQSKSQEIRVTTLNDVPVVIVNRHCGGRGNSPQIRFVILDLWTANGFVSQSTGCEY